MSGIARKWNRLSVVKFRMFAAIAWVVAFGFGLIPAHAEPNTTGKIAIAEGAVEIWRAAFPDRGWHAAAGGMDIFEGDLVRTGRAGSAKVTIYSSTGLDTLDIAPDTILEIAPKSDAGSNSAGFSRYLADLKNGVIRWWSGADQKPVRPERPFNVCTPSVVLGTRDGSGNRYNGPWVVSHVDEGSKTVVLVPEGSLVVTSRKDGSSVRVKSGQKVTASDAVFGKVESFSTMELEAAVRGMPEASSESAHSAGGCGDATGSWTQTHSAGTSTWVLTQTGNGTYQAEERGLGSAKGTATLSGKTLRIDFRTAHANPFVGYYLWELDSDCASGKGKVYQTGGPLKGHSYDCTVTRVK